MITTPHHSGSGLERITTFDQLCEIGAHEVHVMLQITSTATKLLPLVGAWNRGTEVGKL